MSNPASKTNRKKMPKQPVEERILNFKEVALGFKEELALAEAERCLQCPEPSCVEGCPVDIDIPAFIKLIKEKKFLEALNKIREKNNLPAITGRVCPVENQCEVLCILNKIGKPVFIGALERFAADYELGVGPKRKSRPKPGAKMVAVVGSGPAGLTAAADLARRGYRVTVFEGFHDFGGVLHYGIPEFRLPKQIVHHEVEYIKSLGVKFENNTLIGKTLTLEELFELGYEAIFIGAGAGTPYFLNIPGENFNGIYSANEFLTRINLMKAYKFPEYATPIKIGKKVVVVGGGNVAMDSVRTALRLGAEEATIVYRRSREELPARHEEIENAEEEGIHFQFLTNPVRFIGNKKGWVEEVECNRMKLGDLDSSGRRRPIPVEGSEFRISADIVVVAIGQKPNPLISRMIEGLETDRQGCIIVDKNLKTSLERVWAGGDIVSGAATVINAMGMGKKAAKSIDEYLKDKEAE